MAGPDEAFRHGMVQERHQRIVVGGDVEQAARLAVKPELAPGPDLEQLIHGARASGQRDEAVRQLRHQGLPFMHGADHMEPGEPVMGLFLVHESPGHDADDAAPRGKGGVGEDPHQADIGPTVDERDGALGQQLPQVPGLLAVGLLATRRGTTVDADALDVHASTPITNAAGGARAAPARRPGG